MEGWWPMFFMLIVLKVPAIGMIYLLYWAGTPQYEVDPADQGDDGNGGKRRPRPLIPRGPRRGPHGGGAVRPVPRRGHQPEPAAGRRLRPGSGKPEPARARDRETA